VLIKLQSVAVVDVYEVCGTYNRKQMNLLYRGVKRLSTNLAVWEVQPLLLSTTPQKCTLDRRRKDLSGRTVRLTSQDQPTVSHRKVREREAHGDISSEETTRQRLPWGLNARTNLQHCMLTASIPAYTHSLTAALDQLRVVASSTSNDPGPRSRQHQQIGRR